MKEKIIIYMVVRNVSQKQELFENVVKKASEVSKDFFIVNHWSLDNSSEIIKNLEYNYNLSLELINEKFEWTMDEVKWKYYKILKEKFWKTWRYIFILDWDEVLDHKLIKEINNLDFKNDVYLINRHTYFISKIIDRNSYLPLLFKINSVEIAAFEKFHKLYSIKSKNIKKLKWILFHYSYKDIDELFKKNKFYAKWEAEDLFSKNKNISNIKIFFSFIFDSVRYFLYTLFFHYNFLHVEWWLFSFSNIVYMYTKYLYYLEMKEKYKNNYKKYD